MKKKPIKCVPFVYDKECWLVVNSSPHFLYLNQTDASQWSDVQLLSTRTAWSQGHFRRDNTTKMCTFTQTHINVNKTFSCMGLLPVAVWEARVCASGGGLVSCVCPDFDEHCSTHRKSTHPCSPRPSEALRGKKKTTKWKSRRSQSSNWWIDTKKYVI